LAKGKTKTTNETNLVDEAFDRLLHARLDFAHAVVTADAKGDWQDCDICTGAILETEDEYLSAYFDYIDALDQVDGEAKGEAPIPAANAAKSAKSGSKAIAR
jgi:hypothetical protein